ncbi:hypothetical protein B0H13DRAFT_2187275 [Mycena leptocephala]|nr:hypothetical protein B0H13DRAFT_2187275 [Mycena leptocephala]
MDTPFKDILHTNAIPSDWECQIIREMLVEPRREAAELTREIERIQTLLRELTGKRDALQEFVDTHLALISPARRLPEDVVAEIFTASLPADRNAIMSGAESPLLLCQVSRAWRTLALSTPRLWTSLHIVAPGNVSHLRRITEAASIWLSRSGALPLSISLVHTPSFQFAIGADFSVLLEALVQYSSRWNRIRMKFETHRSFMPLTVLSPTDVPILETINIEGFLSEREHVIDWRSLSFLKTTSLRSVTLRGVADLRRVILPCNELRHLSLAHMASASLTAAEGLEMLRWCPNLETCTLPISSVPDNVPRLPLRMEHLRRLSMVEGIKGAAIDLFIYLDLPMLEEVEYAAYVLQSPLESWLASAHHLRCLSFRVEQDSSFIISESLRLAPALQELVLCFDSALDAKFWAAITPTPENHNVLCPELRIVKFMQFMGTSDTVLLEFIRARAESPLPRISRLLKAHVQFKRTMQIDIRPALQQAITDGLDLSLRYLYLPRHSYSIAQDNDAHSGSDMLSDHWDESHFGFGFR